MNIAPFIQIIKKLLLLNKKVTIPKFGQLISETAPSFLSSDGLTIYPPGKRIYFRQDDEKKDDGILLSCYAEQEKVSREKALEDLTAFVLHIQEVLEKDKKYEIEKFGVFKLSGSSEVIFMMDRELDVYAEDFSLQPINLKYRSRNNVGIIVEKELSRQIQEMSEEIAAEETEEPSEAQPLEFVTTDEKSEKAPEVETIPEVEVIPEAEVATETEIETETVLPSVEELPKVSESEPSAGEKAVENVAEETSESPEIQKTPIVPLLNDKDFRPKDKYLKLKIALLSVAVLSVLLIMIELMGFSIVDRLLYSSEERELIEKVH